MSATLPFLTTRSVAVPAEFFATLIGAAGSDASPALTNALRDAGYSAGSALFDSFAAWLAEHGEHSPESLPDERFGMLASEFFAASGWGAISLSQLGDAVIAIDCDDWAEGDSHHGREEPACYVSTGLFAGFFGRLADAPLAVLEVECRSASQSRCRFLLGSVDVLQYVHEAMSRGIPYDRAAASA